MYGYNQYYIRWKKLQHILISFAHRNGYVFAHLSFHDMPGHDCFYNCGGNEKT